MRIGLLHPGEMGAPFGEVLALRGHELLWCSAGRRSETRHRALAAGLEDAGTLMELAARSELILSICPPHAALDLAWELADFPGIFVDANAIAPATAVAIERTVQRFVDGSIIGSPPTQPGAARLYLCGAEATTVAELFADSNVDAHVLDGSIGAASALKMSYAAWTKGSAALLLAVRDAARGADLEHELLDLWRSSHPGLVDRCAAAHRSAAEKGWRWVGEMEEIAGFFAASELPDGFHLAAADIYRRFPRGPDDSLG